VRKLPEAEAEERLRPNWMTRVAGAENLTEGAVDLRAGVREARSRQVPLLDALAARCVECVREQTKPGLGLFAAAARLFEILLGLGDSLLGAAAIKLRLTELLSAASPSGGPPSSSRLRSSAANSFRSMR
jgi:hypothetical protein